MKLPLNIDVAVLRPLPIGELSVGVVVRPV